MNEKKDKTKALLGNLNLGTPKNKPAKQITPVQKEVQNKTELIEEIKEEVKKELEQVKPQRRLGRKPDWPEHVTLMKSTFKVPDETFEAMQQALVSTHRELKSQNRFIDAAIRAFLGMDEN